MDTTIGNTPKGEVTWPRKFEGSDLLQIAMPLGGIGAGCVCLSGTGGLQDFSIRNKPMLTAMPDTHGMQDAAFAILHLKGKRPVTRLVEGPLPVEKVYDQGLGGQGYRKGGHEGLPRFAHAAFEGAYPFGTVSLTDPKLPIRATVTGWSPFVPLDDVASGMPAAILEYTLENTSAEAAEYELSFHLSHLAPGGNDSRGSRTEVIPGVGVFFYNREDPTSEAFGSAALVALEGTPRIKAMWLRGGWFDGLSALWPELAEGRFRENEGLPNDPAADRGGRNGGSILLSGTLAPGETVTHPIALAWHFPNIAYSHGFPKGETPPPSWRPFYAAVWPDARAVAATLRDGYADLRRRTLAFRDALAATTAPPVILDAIASNLAILKSPTVLRQANGNLWAWEGCFATSGCCHGTCTHVWNYAQAFPHLFPALERTLREQEYLRSMDGRGHVNFRAALPDAPTSHDYHAAADGQLGGILKLYRDWQIAGDNDWLARLYPRAKRSLDFCIGIWDPERKGILAEPHHNTYDIEFWGPEPMCATVYVGALAAMAEMSAALGHTEDAAGYSDLAACAATFLDTELFDTAAGYYVQHVQWEGLRDSAMFEKEVAGREAAGDTEYAAVLREEGPKYQYGSGCLSDGVIGAWMARLYGVDTPLATENVRAHLRAIFANNFKADLSEHVCTQRPGYATGREPGLLLCSWPQGGKPTLPFVYSDEVWTGIEYQVATHLLLEGLTEEGLTIVRGARARHNGRARNPFNEYECGNYYARALSSFALLPALSGFRYSAVTRTLWFGPQHDYGDTFTTFFSAATGWGTIRLTPTELTITMTEGELALDQLILTRPGTDARTLPWGAIARAGEPISLSL